MNYPQNLVNEIIAKLQAEKTAQVPGYNSFKYVSHTGSKITLLRENGNTVDIPVTKLVKGIEAVKKEQSVYHGGPSQLRKYGITHINSPIWALLHLLPIDIYRE